MPGELKVCADTKETTEIFLDPAQETIIQHKNTSTVNAPDTADSFNPYRVWLCISVDTPVNNYSLLGLKDFEEDMSVISNAADRQMIYVRTFQTGQHSAESQQILNEISAARICLLNPEKKAEYDRQLRESPLYAIGKTAAEAGKSPQASLSEPVIQPFVPPAPVIPPELPVPPVSQRPVVPQDNNPPVDSQSNSNLSFDFSQLNAPTGQKPSIEQKSAIGSRAGQSESPSMIHKKSRKKSTKAVSSPLQGNFKLYLCFGGVTLAFCLLVGVILFTSGGAKETVASSNSTDPTVSNTEKAAENSSPQSNQVKASNTNNAAGENKTSNPDSTEGTDKTNSVPLEGKPNDFAIPVPAAPVKDEDANSPVQQSGFVNGEYSGQARVWKYNNVSIPFRWCPAGEFIMGSPEGENGHPSSGMLETQHRVRLTKGFWIMKTEITRETWNEVMGLAPVNESEKNLPAVNISWDDCQDFCRRLGNRLGVTVSLPTEAQWEYACRASSTGSFGGTGDFSSMGWGANNSERTVQTMGTKNKNTWGIYDMHGNVQEWCLDSWQADLGQQDQTDPCRKSIGGTHIVRSGNINDSEQKCRSAFRTNKIGAIKEGTLGARVVILPPQ